MQHSLNQYFCRAHLFIYLLLPCAQQLYGQESSFANTDITYYKIDLRLDTLQKKASGEVTINLKLQGHKSPRIGLDLTDSATVNAIFVNGTTVNYQHHNGKLDIVLDAQSRALKKLSILCRYSVPFHESGINLVYLKGQATIYTYGLPYTAKEWWPCKDIPSDKADSADIIIRVARPLSVASNGRLIDVIPVQTENGTQQLQEKQFHWKVTYPIYPDVISLAIADYSQFSIQNKEVPFYFYVFQQDIEKAKIDFPVLAEMIKSHEYYFGPYPFKKEKYGVAEFAMKSYREHQTIPSLGYNYITGYHTADRVLAHELAHQWFGNSLTVKNWKHVWLNESFCNYAYALWMEYKNGKHGYQDAMNKYDSSDFNGPILLTDSANVDSMFTPTTFCKGAWVLHMLRNVMGDSAFFKALKAYAFVYRYKNVETADFREVCESYYHHTLKWFFDEWLIGEGRPAYWYKYRIIKYKSGWNLILSVHQAQANGLIYKMPVDLQFILKNGDIIKKTVWNNKREQRYRFTFNNPCNTIILDPGQKILKEIESKTN